MRDDPSIAFVAERHDDPAIEILVNFGVFAGRDATAAEIDRLAEWLLDEVREVTIVAEERHEIGGTVEASVHLVRVDVDAENVPAEDFEREGLEARLVERAEHWARACVADRPVETPDL
jgi:hypothetical protein